MSADSTVDDPIEPSHLLNLWTDLARKPMVPWGKTDGMILHDYVDEVQAAVDRAVAAGAILESGPLKTDWGTEAAYLRGPGNLIVDLCKDA
jgi:uncharacterized glyoxalase superfamily protein PhnB